MINALILMVVWFSLTPLKSEQECVINSIFPCDVDGLVQDCNNSIANALELLQSCTEPWRYRLSMLNQYNMEKCISHSV